MLSDIIFPSPWNYALKVLLGVIFISNILVIINAIISAQTLRGELGKGLKKIAAGTISYVILFLTTLLLDRTNDQILTAEQIRIYFTVVNFFGSVLLILGYLQIYRISRKLNLF